MSIHTACFDMKKFRLVVRSLLDGTYDLGPLSSPDFCVQLLRLPTQASLSTLHAKLKQSDNQWLSNFILEGGLVRLLTAIETPIERNRLVMLKCLQCAKELMNVQYGMEAVINMGVDNTTCASTLARICHKAEHQLVRKEIFQMVSGIGMYNEKGYSLAVQFLDVSKVLAKKRHRFSLVVDEIRANSGKLASGAYLTVLVGFINCLLSQPESLRERLNVRFEFISKLCSS